MAKEGSNQRDSVQDVMSAFTEFKQAHDSRLDDLQDQIDKVELVRNRPGAPPSRLAAVKPKHEMWVNSKTKESVPVLNHGESLLALEPRMDVDRADVDVDRVNVDRANVDGEPSVGRALRGMILGSKAHDAKQLFEERKALSIGSDPTGGYTVEGRMAAQWIDLLRSAMVLSQAGARTVPMDANTLTIAKVTGDPTVSWHKEGNAINAGEPTFGAVELTARTAVAFVKLSLELAQDSANIEAILQKTLVTSLAQAIDSAGLVGVATDAAVAPMSGAGVFGLTGRNTVTGIGAPTSWDPVVDGIYELLADNVPMESIGALIAHPALWKKMRKLKTGISGDNTPLTMPDEVAKMRKLWTTAAPFTGGNTCSAAIADWRDLLYGVRKQISVRVMQERFLADTLEIGVLVYARVDFAATNASSFCTLEGITV